MHSPPSSCNLPVFVSVFIFIMSLPLPQCPLLTVPSRPVTTKIKMAKDPSRKAAHGKGDDTDLNSLATPKHTPGLSSFWGSKRVEVPEEINGQRSCLSSVEDSFHIINLLSTPKSHSTKIPKKSLTRWKNLEGGCSRLARRRQRLLHD